MLTNTWEWIRLLGLLAYFYFSVAVIFGLLRKSTFITSHKNIIYHLHISAGWLGFITLVGHMLVLLIDSYEPYTVIELLLPFAASYERLFSAFGTLAFYVFLLVMMSSDLWIKKMKRTLWKKVHLLVFPAWLLSLLHAIWIGTDIENTFVLLLYGVSATLIIFLSILRYTTQHKKVEKTGRGHAVRNREAITPKRNG